MRNGSQKTRSPKVLSVKLAALAMATAGPITALAQGIGEAKAPHEMPRDAVVKVEQHGAAPEWPFPERGRASVVKTTREPGDHDEQPETDLLRHLP